MISVIISTLTGGLNHLALLLPDLVKEPDSEIIVINNNSRDGTSQFLERYDCVIKNNNIVKTFAESNNAGARLAQGDTLLFLNNDTRICSGMIAEMKKTLDSSKSIGAVGCTLKLMDNPQMIQHAGVYFTDTFVPYELGLNLPWGLSALESNDLRITKTREVPSVTAACMMMPKKLFFELEGFDEGYRNGWEDTDLMLKVREKGLQIWYTGNTYALHKHFGSRDRGRFAHEKENRERYDSIWVNTGRAKEALKNYVQE